MAREPAELGIIDDAIVRVLAGHGRLRAVVQDFARYPAQCLERCLVAGKHCLHRLALGKVRSEQTGAAEHHREQPDDAHHLRFGREADAELGKVDLSLLAGGVSKRIA